jgi:hypothetical protein
VNGEIHGEGRLVGALRGHGVESIGYQDYPAEHRDRMPGETEGVTPAIEALVVIEDGFGDLGVEAISCHGETELGMTLHEVALVLVEWAWLAEYPRVHVDLAHIVEDTGQGETIEVVSAQAESMAQVNSEIGDPVNVPVQVLYDVLHHLDEEVVRKHVYSHFDTQSLVMTSQPVDKSFGSFLPEPLWDTSVNAASTDLDTAGRVRAEPEC